MNLKTKATRVIAVALSASLFVFNTVACSESESVVTAPSQFKDLYVDGAELKTSDENFSFSEGKVVLDKGVNTDYAFSTLSFDLKLENKKYKEFLKDSNDYAMHAFFLHEKVLAPEGEGEKVLKDEIVYGVYNFVSKGINAKTNKHERNSVWGHKQLNGTGLERNAIEFDPPQTNAANVVKKTSDAYEEEEIAMLMSGFNDTDIIFDYTLTETATWDSGLEETLAYNNDVLSIKVNVGYNLYTEYYIEYSYRYYDGIYQGDSCNGCASEETVAEKGAANHIASKSVSVCEYLKSQSLEDFCGGDTVLMDYADSIITGMTYTTISVDYLVQIDGTPFAKKQTAKNIQVQMKGYDDDGKKKLDAPSVFAAIEDQKKVDASVCLGSYFSEFEEIGSNHYKVIYADGASVNVKTEHAQEQQAVYYLNINQSFKEYFDKKFPVETFFYEGGNGELIDLTIGKDPCEYFYNQLMQSNYGTEATRIGKAELYGYWGFVMVPTIYNVEYAINNILGLTPETGTLEGNITLKTLPANLWVETKIDKTLYNKLQDDYKQDNDYSLVGLLDKLFSSVIWDQGRNHAYILPLMMTGAGSGVIAFNTHILSDDPAALTKIKDVFGIYNSVENLEKSNKIMSVAMIAITVVLGYLVIDRIKNRDYY